jgi:glutamate synthase (ferredoxin)
MVQVPLIHIGKCEIIRDQVDKGFITGMTPDYAIANYNKAITKGILKIMNKIGISTLHSYRALSFRNFRFKQKLYTSIFSNPFRIEGISLMREVKKKIQKAFQIRLLPALSLEIGGIYRWKNRGHMFNPTTQLLSCNRQCG